MHRAGLDDAGSVGGDSADGSSCRDAVAGGLGEQGYRPLALGFPLQDQGRRASLDRDLALVLRLLDAVAAGPRRPESAGALWKGSCGFSLRHPRGFGEQGCRAERPPRGDSPRYPWPTWRPRRSAPRRWRRSPRPRRRGRPWPLPLWRHLRRPAGVRRRGARSPSGPRLGARPRYRRLGSLRHPPEHDDDAEQGGEAQREHDRE